MICKDWLAEQRRILEQYGLIGERNELEMPIRWLQVGNLRDLSEPEGNADHAMLQAMP